MTQVAPDLTAAARELSASVTRLSRRLRRERPPHGFGLTKLAFLGQLGRGGPATTSELAAAQGVAHQSAARAVQELVEAGLVARERDPRDGRQVLLRLSDAGRELLAADLAQRDAWLARAMAQRCSDVERDLLLLASRLLDRLADPE